jgi:hypothetical protein
VEGEHGNERKERGVAARMRRRPYGAAFNDFKCVCMCVCLCLCLFVFV